MCCPSDPFGPEPYKCLLTRSNRTGLRRGHMQRSYPLAHPIKWIFYSFRGLNANFHFSLPFPSSVTLVHNSIFPSFLFGRQSPTPTCMQYSLESDVGFIINVKYSCYLLSIFSCIHGLKVCLRGFHSAEGHLSTKRTRTLTSHPLLHYNLELRKCMCGFCHCPSDLFCVNLSFP